MTTPGTAHHIGAEGESSEPTGTVAASAAHRVPPRRLSLGDPLDGRASEDRPEAWGERGENESDRLARYRSETPPHHGG